MSTRGGESGADVVHIMCSHVCAERVQRAEEWAGSNSFHNLYSVKLDQSHSLRHGANSIGVERRRCQRKYKCVEGSSTEYVWEGC